MSDTCYRIRHVATGLFYRPCYDVNRKLKRDDGQWAGVYISCKSNLSDTGKRYSQKPTTKSFGGEIYNHVTVIKRKQDWLAQDPKKRGHVSTFGENKPEATTDSDWCIEKLENGAWVPA